MERFSIHVDGPPIERSQSGQFLGGIFVQLGDTCFPDPEWTDFVVIILAWWCDAFAATRDVARGQLQFMDGPFLVRLTKNDKRASEIEVTLVRETSGSPKVMMRGVVEQSEVERQLISACRAALAQASAIDPNDRFVVLLREKLSALDSGFEAT